MSHKTILIFQEEVKHLDDKKNKHLTLNFRYDIMIIVNNKIIILRRDVDMSNIWERFDDIAKPEDVMEIKSQFSAQKRDNMM